MGGVDELIEIDESMMRGHSNKYHRGRPTPYQIEQRHADLHIKEIRKAIAKIPNAVYDDDDNIDNERNYGFQIEGRWVVGMAHWHSKQWQIDNEIGCETRFFHVERRDAETLLPLIQRHVHDGSIVFTDQWKAYVGLTKIGYAHQTVNHSENMVDPITLVNTQLIESSWRDLRLHIVRQTRNVRNNLPKYLAEYWWRSLHKNPANRHRPHTNIFEYFLMLISSVYGYLD
jgi:transposase-like protein